MLARLALRVCVSLCFAMPIQIWIGLKALNHGADVTHDMRVRLAGEISDLPAGHGLEGYGQVFHGPPSLPAGRRWCRLGRLMTSETRRC